MKKTVPLANRIIAEHAGRDSIEAQEFATVKVDRIYVQDGNAPTIAKLFRENGITKVENPDRIGFFFDHSVLVPDSAMADRIKEAEVFASTIGVQVSTRGLGISHVIAMEDNWFVPGNLVLGADSHTCTGGAVQSLALGMGSSDIVAAMVTGKTWLKVPDTLSLIVEGSPHPATRAKDVVLYALRKFGPRQFLNKSIEWTGEWSHQLSSDAAATVASMGVEMGAKCVFLPPGPNRPEGMMPIEPLEEKNCLRLNLNHLTPQISLPHLPGNTVPLETVSGEHIDYVFIGSCTNSRLEDIAEAAHILGQAKVHPHVHCVITPGSRKIYLKALQLGYVETLTQAGALVTPPGCGACVGTQGSVPASGEKVLTTMNRNYQGRMGNTKADIFLSSPLVAATAAVHGRFPKLSELNPYD